MTFKLSDQESKLLEQVKNESGIEDPREAVETFLDYSRKAIAEKWLPALALRVLLEGLKYDDIILASFSRADMSKIIGLNLDEFESRVESVRAAKGNDSVVAVALEKIEQETQIDYMTIGVFVAACQIYGLEEKIKRDIFDQAMVVYTCVLLEILKRSLEGCG